jgi:heme exporter protein B
MLLKHIFAIFMMELKLELRQKHTLAGIILFIISTVFLIFKGFNELAPQAWNVLFWIVIMFSGVNAIAKSFAQQNSNIAIFNYTLYNPLSLILAKLLYNFVYILLLVAIAMFVFTILGGNFIKNWSLFLQALLLGAFGLSSIYTFISAVSLGENNNSTLMAVLSFPLVIPIFLILLRVTSISIGLMQDTSVGTDLIILLGIDLLLSGIILLLFSFLWKQ